MESQLLEGFNPSMLWQFVIVAVGLATIALLVCNLISKIRELRKPQDDSKKSVMDMLATDNKRIEKLEKTTAKQTDELHLLLVGQMALLHHQIDGNHTQDLKESQRQIEYFLTFGKLEGQ